MSYLRKNERFDRGFYAGPFGYLTGGGAEFVVGIRSALISAPNYSENEHLYCAAESSSDECDAVGWENAHEHVHSSPTTAQRDVMVYTGVGIVQGSDAELEWRELELKALPFQQALRPATALSELPNINAL